MPPKHGPKSTSRKNNPVSPPRPASSTAGSPKQTRRSGRGASREQDELKVQRGSVELGLEPVAELDEDAAAATAAQIAGVPESSAGSDDSDHSSVTQGELDVLDYEFIVDSLSDLHREALKIIDIFAGHTANSFAALAADLKEPESKASLKFRYHWGKLSSTFQRFETGKRIYIIPETIVRKLAQGTPWMNISDGKWRPDAILYIANLAQLMAATFSGDEDHLDTYFEALMKYFPRAFTSSVDESRFTTEQIVPAEEFERAFRTQFFIHIARRDSRKPSYDPGDTLKELFPVEKEPRAAEINKFVTINSKNPVKIDPLAKAFPWHTYLTQVVDWVVTRTNELQAQIAAQGGIDHIVHCIEEGDFSPLGYQQAQPAVPEQPFPLDPNLPGVTEQSRKPGPGLRTIPPKLREEIGKLKAMEAARAAGNDVTRGSGQLEAAAARLSSAFHADGPDNNDPFEQGPPPPEGDDAEVNAQTSLVLQTIASQAQESNKENIQDGITRQVSLLDRQPNARKVPFSDTQSPGKRRRDGEDSDDDAFQSDQRPVKQIRRGRPPRASQSLQITPGPSGQLPSASQQAPVRTPAEAYDAPPSTAPARTDADAELPRSSQWQEANREAKVAAKFNRERTLDTKVQSRKPWTQDEVNRLMELIELNGPAYSRILQDDNNPEYYPDGPMLHGRNQVQLKDKARNMKLDFIKARHMLPPGFSQVSIGKRHVEILRNNFGIDYIDGDGRGANLGVMEEE